ncbi:MAG: PilZ domain-containing protein [Elusimicrobia bacterium]|nr:PilZ domain-containing protein [Elusimicrobiota bacterium]
MNYHKALGHSAQTVPADIAQGERRQHVRHDRELDVMLRPRHPAEEPRKGSIADLSPGGMRLQSMAELPVGEEFQFTLPLDTGITLRGMALVRWACQTGPGYLHGLEIMDMKFWDRRHLSRFLSPRYFDFVDVLDLALQFGFVAIGVLMASELFYSNPHLRQALRETLPLGLASLAALLGLYLAYRRR